MSRGIAIFREICAIALDDSVIFDAGALQVDLIREDNAYGGLRLKTNAMVSSARVRVVVDIGLGRNLRPGVVLSETPAHNPPDL